MTKKEEYTRLWTYNFDGTEKTACEECAVRLSRSNSGKFVGLKKWPTAVPFTCGFCGQVFDWQRAR